LTQALKLRPGFVLIGATFALLVTACNTQNSPDVMAKVNSYKIMRAEVDKSYNRQVASAAQKLTSEQEEAVRLEILRQIMTLQLYLQKAEKLGVVATDEEIEGRLNQDKAPYTKEEFGKKLQEAGFTEDEYKQEIRRKLTIDKLLNKEIASRVTISDTDIQSYYNEHKTQFNVIEPQYYLAHIFVSGQPNAPSSPLPGKAQNDAQAHEKIKMIYSRLESGEDFATLAGKYSEDPNTASNGGELGPAPESQIKNTEAATREAISKLKPGQFSEIIPLVNPATQKTVAYRIVKLIGKEAAGQRDLSDPAVQQQIRGQLRNQREQFLRTAYDEVLHDNAEIRNYYAEQIVKSTTQK